MFSYIYTLGLFWLELVSLKSQVHRVSLYFTFDILNQASYWGLFSKLIQTLHKSIPKYTMFRMPAFTWANKVPFFSSNFGPLCSKSHSFSAENRPFLSSCTCSLRFPIWLEINNAYSHIHLTFHIPYIFFETHFILERRIFFILSHSILLQIGSFLTNQVNL